MAYLLRFFIMFILVDFFSRSRTVDRWRGKLHGLEAVAARRPWLAPSVRLAGRLRRRIRTRRFPDGA